MTTGYSTLTKREARRDIRVMKRAAAKINASPRSARAFLIAAGILSKNGRSLAPQYR